jgi:putative component of membrane protein insertase Oxa1/YidC/SpoIIIJ protein YidD
MEAVERFGAFRGCVMAVGRVLRCHPLAKGGLDPVLKNNSRKSPVYGAPNIDIDTEINKEMSY